jgi:hypothetical protein
MGQRRVRTRSTRSNPVSEQGVLDLRENHPGSCFKSGLRTLEHQSSAACRAQVDDSVHLPASRMVHSLPNWRILGEHERLTLA